MKLTIFTNNAISNENLNTFYSIENTPSGKPVEKFDYLESFSWRLMSNIRNEDGLELGTEFLNDTWHVNAEYNLASERSRDNALSHLKRRYTLANEHYRNAMGVIVKGMLEQSFPNFFGDYLFKLDAQNSLLEIFTHNGTSADERTKLGYIKLNDYLFGETVLARKPKDMSVYDFMFTQASIPNGDQSPIYVSRESFKRGANLLESVFEYHAEINSNQYVDLCELMLEWKHAASRITHVIRVIAEATKKQEELEKAASTLKGISTAAIRAQYPKAAARKEAFAKLGLSWSNWKASETLLDTVDTAAAALLTFKINHSYVSSLHADILNPFWKEVQEIQKWTVKRFANRPAAAKMLEEKAAKEAAAAKETK